MGKTKTKAAKKMGGPKMYGGLQKYNDNESFEVVLKLLHKNASKLINPSDPNAKGTTANVWLLRHEEPLPEGQARPSLVSTRQHDGMPHALDTFILAYLANCVKSCHHTDLGSSRPVYMLDQVPWNNNCCLNGQGGNQLRMNRRARAKGIAVHSPKKLTPAAVTAKVQYHRHCEAKAHAYQYLLVPCTTCC